VPAPPVAPLRAAHRTSPLQRLSASASTRPSSAGDYLRPSQAALPALPLRSPAAASARLLHALVFAQLRPSPRSASAQLRPSPRRSKWEMSLQIPVIPVSRQSGPWPRKRARAARS